MEFFIGDFYEARCCKNLSNAIDEYLSRHDDADLLEFVANSIREHKEKGEKDEIQSR